MTIDFEMLDFLVWKAHGISCLSLMQFVWVILEFTAFVTCYNFFFQGAQVFPKFVLIVLSKLLSSSAFCWSLTFFDTMFAQKFVALWSLGTAV